MRFHSDLRVRIWLAYAFWKCSSAAESPYHTITIPTKLPATLTTDGFTFTLSSIPSSATTATYGDVVVDPGSSILQEVEKTVIYSGSFILVPTSSCTYSMTTGVFCGTDFYLLHFRKCKKLITSLDKQNL